MRKNKYNNLGDPETWGMLLHSLERSVSHALATHQPMCYLHTSLCAICTPTHFKILMPISAVQRSLISAVLSHSFWRALSVYLRKKCFSSKAISRWPLISFSLSDSVLLKSWTPEAMMTVPGPACKKVRTHWQRRDTFFFNHIYQFLGQ